MPALRSRNCLPALMIASGAIALAPACLATDAFNSTATVEVIGGPHAGIHTIDADSACSYAANQKSRHFDTMLLNNKKDPKALSQLGVSLGNMTGPTTTNLADFKVYLKFGKFDDSRGTAYLAGTQPVTLKTGGPGRVTFKDAGKNVQLSFEVQPQPGITVKGSVSCAAARY